MAHSRPKMLVAKSASGLEKQLTDYIDNKGYQMRGMVHVVRAAAHENQQGTLYSYSYNVPCV